MTPQHGKGTRILMGDLTAGLDVSAWLDKAMPSINVDTPECTTFGKNSKTYIGGLLDGKLSLEGYYDFVKGPPDTGIDATVLGVLGQDQNSSDGSVIVLALLTGGTTFGERALSSAGVIDNYEIDTPVDGIITVKAELQVDKRITGDLVLIPYANRSAGVTSTVQDDGVGVAALTKALVFTAVATVMAGGGSNTVKLQTSPDNSVWTDVPGATFTIAASTPSAQRVRVAGAFDRYVRAVYTGTTNCTLVASYCREYV